MAPDPTVSVIIPALDAAATICDQLEALDRQVDAPPFEVVVADNGSRDATAAIVAAHRPRGYRLRLVDASHRRGPAAARNAAVATAVGELLVYCDADDVVSARYVGAMARALARWDLASGIRSSEAFGEADRVPLERLERIEAEQRDRPAELMRVTGFCDQVMTSALGVRRTVHETVGGFREDLVGGGEDLHYGSVAQIAGYRLGPADGALVHVRPVRGLGAHYRQQRAWSYRGLQVLWELREHGRREFSLAASARGVLTALADVFAARRRNADARIDAVRTLGNHVGELQANLRFRSPHIARGLVRRVLGRSGAGRGRHR